MVWRKRGPNPRIQDRAERFLKDPNKFLKPAKMASERRNEKLNLAVLVNKKYPAPKHTCSVYAELPSD